MLQFVHSLISRDERGQGLAEYALILALIAVLAIAAVKASSSLRSRWRPARAISSFRRCIS